MILALPLHCQSTAAVPYLWLESCMDLDYPCVCILLCHLLLLAPMRATMHANTVLHLAFACRADGVVEVLVQRWTSPDSSNSGATTRASDAAAESSPLAHASEAHRTWLCVSCEVTNPPVDRSGKWRESTTVQVALPLPSAAHMAGLQAGGAGAGAVESAVLPEDAQVYAYLPIRSYGLPFALQVGPRRTVDCCIGCQHTAIQVADVYCATMIAYLQNGMCAA